METKTLSHWGYCQFLLVSQVNYTQTYFADHTEDLSHPVTNELGDCAGLGGVTNDLSQDSTDDTKAECDIRWKIEQFHREAKQVTGIEASQCRSQRAQRNHIACALLVWVRLNQIANATQSTIYQLKQGLLDDYMNAQLRNPAISIRPA
jgi:hypothetical protein